MGERVESDRPARRQQVTDAVIDLVAAHGVRSLTHRAVDRALGLPAGSTSYYFRTRRALLEATAAELAVRARQDFRASGLGPPAAETTLGEIAAAIGSYVAVVAESRRAETVARHALRLELAHDARLRTLLVPGPFSVEVATDLMATLGAVDPGVAGRGLVNLLEGLLLEQVTSAPNDAGPGSPADRLAGPVELYLRGAAGPSSRSDGSSATAAERPEPA